MPNCHNPHCVGRSIAVRVYDIVNDPPCSRAGSSAALLSGVEDVNEDRMREEQRGRIIRQWAKPFSPC